MENKYKFMQIYGNCTATHCLGVDRIKGPVDNVVAKGIKFLQLLLSDTYVTYLKTTPPKLSPRKPSFKNDSTVSYIWPVVDIVHNDPRTPKAMMELEARMKNFNEFRKKVVLDKNYYFIYCLNYYDLDKSTHLIRRDRFIENINYLQSKNLLSKTIFVETKHNDPNAFWNFYATNIDDLIKKYNLKYIQMNGVEPGKNITPELLKTIPEQFYKKAVRVIEGNSNEKSSNN